VTSHLPDTASSRRVWIDALIAGEEALASVVVAASFTFAREGVTESRLTFHVRCTRAKLGFGLRTTTLAINTEETRTSASAQYFAVTSIGALPHRIA
jgi:hypothetical protein